MASLGGITNSIQGIAGIALVIPAIAGLFGPKTDATTIGYQPQNPDSPTGQIQSSVKALLFHYEGEQTVTIESDITDHFVEDNTAVQDQIALKPPRITTHGFIGELNDVPPSFLGPLSGILSRLGPINAFAPGFSATATNAINTAKQAVQLGQTLANTAVGVVAALSGQAGESVIDTGGVLQSLKNQNLQQTMFQTFYGYWRERRLFTIQTPWAVFKNVAIERLRAIQAEESAVITDFEVTFKVIRTVLSLNETLPLKDQRAFTQSLSAVSQGTVTGQKADGISV